MPRRSAWLLLTFLGCGDGTITECKSTSDAHVICGLQNPEDLAVIPGRQALVVSQLGSTGMGKPGGLAWLDIASERIEPLFPQRGIGTEPDVEKGPDWGSPACPGAPGSAFDPHGINLHTRPDGRLELFVVNHGGREAVELFELDPESHHLGWRGCVPLPAGSFLNGVAALPGGGFAVTHMFTRTGWVSTVLGLVESMLGYDTGWVMTWHPGTEPARLPGSEGSTPNGIVATPDGRELFVCNYTESKVRHYALPSGELLGEVEIAHPDNVRWSDDGGLLVASLASMASVLICSGVQEAACKSEFEIIHVDPKTLRQRVLVHRAGEPMGAATVGLAVRDSLFVGSFRSGWLMKLPRP